MTLEYVATAMYDETMTGEVIGREKLFGDLKPAILYALHHGADRVSIRLADESDDEDNG